jgi:hypothetical protein
MLTTNTSNKIVETDEIVVALHVLLAHREGKKNQIKIALHVE